MQLPFLEQAYLLQSLGWAIANSFWQVGSLWLIYQGITALDKKLTATVKHHLTIVLLVTSFIWFILTIVQNYRLLLSGTGIPGMIQDAAWIMRFQPFNNILPYFSVIYLALLCMYTIKFLRSLSANHFLQTKGLSRAPIDFRLFIKNTAIHLGIKSNIQVWLSAHVDVPSVTGFLKPVILLPAAIINHLSIQQIEAVLLHELAHIKRNDYLVNLLQSVIELILFFNPFAILLSRASKKEREHCCDDWVMNFKYDRYEYANALLVLEEQRHHYRYSFAMTATSGKKKLLLRVKRLFNVQPTTGFSAFQKFKFAGLCLVLFTTVFMSPYIIHQSEPGDVKIDTKEKKSSLVEFAKQPVEKAAKNVFTSQPIKQAAAKKPVGSKKNSKKTRSNETETDYVNAFINEELLDAAPQVEPMLTQVADIEINNSIYFIKIEEHQSGKKQTNTYYFELKDGKGGPAIKPLIMLNKVRVPFKLSKKEKSPAIPDTLNTARPKRVTS